VSVNDGDGIVVEVIVMDDDKKRRGGNYSEHEDAEISKAWLSVSQDSLKGSDQKDFFGGTYTNIYKHLSLKSKRSIGRWSR